MWKSSINRFWTKINVKLSLHEKAISDHTVIAYTWYYMKTYELLNQYGNFSLASQRKLPKFRDVNSKVISEKSSQLGAFGNT